MLFVVDKGVVAESGNHDELMNKQGIYSQLVARQMAGNEGGLLKSNVVYLG